MKRLTRKLERQYRRLNTPAARTAWCIQYRSQHRLFEAKFTSFCCSTIDSCHNNPHALWRAIRQLTEPPQQSPTVKFTAHDFASFFRDKIATIRQSTASSPQPVIQPRNVPVLSHFDAVTEHEVQSLLMSVPATSCPLDPIPT